MLILERIVSTNSPTEFIEARKEGRVISPTLLQPRSYNQDPRNSLGTLVVYTHPPLATRLPLSLENQKEPLLKMRNSTLHNYPGFAESMYCRFGIAETIFNKTNAWCWFSISNFDVILSSASLFLRLVPGMPCISTGAPSSERSHDSNTLTSGRSSLNRASDAYGMQSLRMGSSYFLPLTSKPIALSLSSESIKSSWTLSG